MRNLICLLLLFIYQLALGQNATPTPTYWSPNLSEKYFFKTDSTKLYFRLNHKKFTQLLAQAPREGVLRKNQAKTILGFPLPNGSMQEFLIEEISNFHPELAAKFPTIKTYKGRAIDNSGNSLRFSNSPKGISAMIQSGSQPAVFINQSKENPLEIYQVHYKKADKNDPFLCETYHLPNSINTIISNQRRNNEDCQLRTFRLALACTGEYAQYHGGTETDVLAAMNNTLTIINGIFERDLAIHLELIPNNTDLIFLNQDTDPYSNGELADMLGENQSTCDAIIGQDNYDIGHVLGTGLGGVAFLGIVCESNFKASGATGFNRPEGPIFAIDLVTHELGHQFGARHTFNGDQVACAGSNRSEETSVEPGSGSTIMGYAGICPPQNIQNNSDGYFHAISLQQIRNTLNRNEKCAEVAIAYENTVPTFSTQKNTYYIPKSTPFALTTTATDESTNLTYTWEQMDKEIAPQPPLPSNQVGPLFRSLPPNESPVRYFPNLKDLVNNNAPKWEVLPSVARTLNFRGTIRDNQSGGGCTNEVDIQVIVEDVLPFKVVRPNLKAIWMAGTQKEVLWDVGRTAIAPINAPLVDILLSLDGGFTYPINLAEGIPNTGKKIVLVPNSVTNTARILVRGTDHIFFDISDENFEITKPANDFEINVVNATQSVCLPELANFEIEIGETGNFVDSVALSVEGLPEGVIADFSNQRTTVPNTVTLSLSNLMDLSGTLEFDLIAQNGDNAKTRTLTIFVAERLPEKAVLLAPANSASNTPLKPILEWTAIGNVEAYQLEISTSPSFLPENSIIYSVKNTRFELPNSLNNATKYYWRISGQNACGVGENTANFVFETANEICDTYLVNDLPQNIPSLFRSTVISEIRIADKGKLLDLNIKNLKVSHDFIGDILVELESPSGTTVRLVEQICNADKDLQLNFDSESSRNYAEIPCPPISTNFYESLASLNIFNGEEVSGIWQLKVIDTELLDGGAFENWELEICYQKEKPLGLVSNKISVSCFGQADGILSVIPEGGTGNYQYSWSTGDTTAIVSGLSAGSYAVTIFDGQNSMDTILIIEEPTLLGVQSNLDRAGCIGENNGQISTIVTGGVLPYNFQWSNGAITADLINLNSGNYRVTVTDGVGCNQINSVDLVAHPLVEFMVSNQINPSCPNDLTGSVSLVDLKENDLSFFWSNGVEGATQNNLLVGQYSVTATDKNGCTGEMELTITQEPDTVKPILALQNTLIYLDNDGLANLDVSLINNGSFDNCGTLQLQANRTNFDCQSIGNQPLIIQATDDVGNVQSGEVNIQIIDTLAPVFECLEEIYLVGCQSIRESDYPKAIDNCSSTNVQLLQSGDGGYSSVPDVLSFEAKDNNGNFAYCYIPMRRENNFSANINGTAPLCVGDNNGIASVVGVNGQPPYTYQWNDENKQTTATANQLISGEYEVTINDNTGCQVIKQISLNTPSSISLVETNISDEVNGNANGEISIEILGGTGNLRVIWFKVDTVIGNGLIIENLSAGEYEVQVTDENNCFFSEKFTVGLLTNTAAFSFIENINLYPNPTKGIVTLQVNLIAPQPFAISVYNLLGEEIMAPFFYNTNKEMEQLDFSAFEDGVYFVKFSFEEGVLSKKILLLK